MGSHTWVEHCSYCGFEEMKVFSVDGIFLGANCPICGYARWTEEKVPRNNDIKLVKRTLKKMSANEKQKIVELYDEDNIPLVDRVTKN